MVLNAAKYLPAECIMEVRGSVHFKGQSRSSEDGHLFYSISPTPAYTRADGGLDSGSPIPQAEDTENEVDPDDGLATTAVADRGRFVGSDTPSTRVADDVALDSSEIANAQHADDAIHNNFVVANAPTAEPASVADPQTGGEPPAVADAPAAAGAPAVSEPSALSEAAIVAHPFQVLAPATIPETPTPEADDVFDSYEIANTGNTYDVIYIAEPASIGEQTTGGEPPAVADASAVAGAHAVAICVLRYAYATSAASEWAVSEPPTLRDPATIRGAPAVADDVVPDIVKIASTEHADAAIDINLAVANTKTAEPASVVDQTTVVEPPAVAEEPAVAGALAVAEPPAFAEAAIVTHDEPTHDVPEAHTVADDSVLDSFEIANTENAEDPIYINFVAVSYTHLTLPTKRIV